MYKSLKSKAYICPFSLIRYEQLSTNVSWCNTECLTCRHEVWGLRGLAGPLSDEASASMKVNVL